MNKLVLGLLALGLTLTAQAQQAPQPTPSSTPPPVTVAPPPPQFESAFSEPSAYRGEFTIGGSGAANHDINSSLGGFSFSLGHYFTPSLVGLVRQSVNYSNPDNADSVWNGWTRLAFDQHFGEAAFRPFLGINAGRIYGDSVSDTWTAGLETGAKLYVTNRTFLQVTVEYGWFFDRGNEIDDDFDDGAWSWNVGLGFRF